MVTSSAPTSPQGDDIRTTEIGHARVGSPPPACCLLCHCPPRVLGLCHFLQPTSLFPVCWTPILQVPTQTFPKLLSHGLIIMFLMFVSSSRCWAPYGYRLCLIIHLWSTVTCSLPSKEQRRHLVMTMMRMRVIMAAVMLPSSFHTPNTVLGAMYLV